jgi:outer membrane biosynthesis protein TonB
VALLAALLSLCACSTGAVLGQLPEKMGGLPADAPQRPAETMPFPHVYEQRPTRATKPLTEEEQKKLESELGSLRDSQNRRALAPESPPAGPRVKDAAKPPPKAPPKKMAEKPKPKAEAPARKSEDSVVPEKKGSSSLKPIE